MQNEFFEIFYFLDKRNHLKHIFFKKKKGDLNVQDDCF
jgi:hypothetical protein